jgi:hypothetical protein
MAFQRYTRRGEPTQTHRRLHITQTIAYKLSIDLADILQPLVGKMKYHVENSKDLVNEFKSVKLEKDEIMISYDVVSLFTKTPIHGASNAD